MKIFFLTKNTACGLFISLLCFWIADYAVSAESDPQGNASGVPFQIKKIETQVRELRMDVRNFRKVICDYYLLNDLPLPESCSDCPCWTEQMLKNWYYYSSSTKDIQCKDVDGGDVLIRRVVSDCQLSPGSPPVVGYTMDLVTMNNDQWRCVSKDMEEIECPFGVCTNYEKPQVMRNITAEEAEDCKILLRARIDELGLQCFQ